MTKHHSISTLKALLSADDRITIAILFGSAVRNCLRPDSELDLAVLSRDQGERQSVNAKLLNILGRLAIQSGRNIHLVDLESADVELRRRVFDEGTILVNRSPERLRTTKVKTLLEYFDWAYARSVIDRGHATRLRG